MLRMSATLLNEYGMVWYVVFYGAYGLFSIRVDSLRDYRNSVSSGRSRLQAAMHIDNDHVHNRRAGDVIVSLMTSPMTSHRQIQQRCWTR